MEEAVSIFTLQQYSDFTTREKSRLTQAASSQRRHLVYSTTHLERMSVMSAKESFWTPKGDKTRSGVTNSIGPILCCHVEHPRDVTGACGKCRRHGELCILGPGLAMP